MHAARRLRLTSFKGVDFYVRAGRGAPWVLLHGLAGTLCLLLMSSGYNVLLMLPLSVIYYRLARYYRHSSRELQRLDSVSKSPIYAAFTEALNGTASIRAFGAVSRFEAANRLAIDSNMKA